MRESLKWVWRRISEFADVAKQKLVPPEQDSECGKLNRREFRRAFSNSLKAGTAAGIISSLLFSLATYASAVPGVIGFLLTAFLWLAAEIAKRFNDGS